MKKSARIIESQTPISGTFFFIITHVHVHVKLNKISKLLLIHEKEIKSYIFDLRFLKNQSLSEDLTIHY